MTTLVATWQEGSDPTTYSDNGLGVAGTFFESNLRLLVDLISGSAKQHLDTDTFHHLRAQAQRFNLWGYGFSVKQGKLDGILADSHHLRKTVLSFLSALGSTLVELAKKLVLDGTFDDTGLSPLSKSCKQIEILMEQVAKITDEPVDTNDDEASSSGSEISSFDELKELVEDIKTYVDCFMDLVPTLENPAKNSDPGEEPGDVLVGFGSLAIAARPRGEGQKNSSQTLIDENSREVNARSKKDKIMDEKQVKAPYPKQYYNVNL